MRLIKILAPTLLLISIASTSTFAVDAKGLPDGFTTLHIGDSAPNFNLPGIDGKQYSLSDFARPDILVVYFTGTHCPTSHGAMGRVLEFVEDFQDESFAFVAINPNHSSGLRPDEFGHTDYD